LHLARSIFLWRSAFHQRLRIRNYGRSPVRVPLSIQIEADFVDIFEVRGTARARRGRRLEARHDPTCLHIAYEGLDSVVRELCLECTPRATDVSPGSMRFEMLLDPDQEETIYLTAHCRSWTKDSKPGAYTPDCPYEEAFVCAASAQQSAKNLYCE